MPTLTDTWGWYATGLTTSGGDDAQTLGGNSYDIGTDFSFAAYGDMQMYDVNDDDRIFDTDTGDGTSDVGDRLVTPDSVYRQVNEVVIYSNTVITYTLPGGGTATWTVNLVVWQLGNGDLVMRLNDGTVASAPADFNAANVTNITLGTWDGTDYSAGLPSNFDSPPPVCFASGTLIETDRGPVRIEQLKVGDLVKTRDCGCQPIRWIGSRKLTAAELEADPSLRPIRIRADALGMASPAFDLIVSPQHRVLVRSKIAQRMFDTCEVLVAAKQLLQVDGISIAEDMQEVEYFHFLFDDHQIVFSNGAETESLYAGPMALKSVGLAALEEIYTILPELRDRDMVERPDGARTLLSGQQGRKLAARHARNRKPLFLPVTS